MTQPQPSPTHEPITPGFQGTAAEWREIAEILAAVVIDQERYLRKNIETAEKLSDGCRKDPYMNAFRTEVAGALSSLRVQLDRFRPIDLTLARSVVAWMEE